MTSYLWTAVIFALMIPLLVISFVPFLRKSAAKGKPNPLFGFRTPTTMSSPENWATAQSLSAKYYLPIGLVALALTVLTYLVLFATGNRDANLWYWVALILTTALMAAILICSVSIHRRLHR